MEELFEKLKSEGYHALKRIEGRGICGYRVFLFTVGVCHGLDEFGYEGRWCYDSELEAMMAITVWDGVGDPPGNWIKYKSHKEDRPRLPDQYQESA